MISKYKIQTYRLLESLSQIENNQRARLKELDSYVDKRLRVRRYPDGKEYFCEKLKVSKDGRATKYLGDGRNETVQKVKEAKYLSKSITTLGKDIKILQSVVDGLSEVDQGTINEMLPATYRIREISTSNMCSKKASEWRLQMLAYKDRFTVYRPEDLKHKTDDGTMVRSKSEAIIYNLLLRLGITFVYELPIRTASKTFFPDFSILSEIDYTSVILLEHQGMMDDANYRERFKEKVYEYLRAGYVQGVNIFYTFDRLDGGIDTDPILDMIKIKIRPSELDRNYRSAGIMS